MLNCYGQHKAAEAQRTAASASERYAADERVRAVRDAHSKFIAAEHAKNVAAEARMRDPSIWRQAVGFIISVLYGVALAGVIMLIATLLGN
jgi:hypothetical protein